MSIVTRGQSGAALTDEQESAPAPVKGARRSAILDWLQESDGPRTAAEVAEHADLHLNTARFHLDALVQDGHAERHHEDRGTPGRPRVLYSARPADASVRSYRLLSDMLVGLVRSLGGEDAAEEAGRSWGRHLVAAERPTGSRDRAAALTRLDALMDRVGFRPETRDGDTPEVRLHHCPFIEVVDGNQDVVCALHRGLIQGALEGSPVEVASLRPFATPRTCVAHLTSTDTSPTRRPS